MSESAERKRRVKDCEVRGEPAEGNDYFVCEDCLVEFAKKLEQVYLKRCERHANN